MNKINITTDADKAFETWKEFTLKEMDKAEKAAIRKAASQLQKEVRGSLKKSLHAASKRGQKLTKEVRITKVKKDKKSGDYATYVTIMPKGRQGGVLIFFELGTQPRYAYTRKTNHKQAFRGKIAALNFYESAYSRFKNEYDKIISDELEKAIKKINEKRK